MEIINNLTSTSTTDGLSANQGRVLNEKIGELPNLETEAKNNIVSSINEIVETIDSLSNILDEINGEIVS